MLCDIEIMIYFIPLLIISMIFSLIVPFMYFVSPKTRHHPAILYLSMSILEYMQCYQILVQIIFICKPISLYGLAFCFQFLELKEETFIFLNDLLIFLILELQIIRDICFCIDILLTLKIPFYPTRLRIRGFGLFALVVLGIRFIIYQPIEDYLDFYLFDEILLFLQALLMITTLGVILQTLFQAKKIKDPEIQKAKANYLRQVTYLLVACEILWIIYFLFYFYYPQCFELVFVILGISQGILSGLIRCEEFFFRAKLVLIIKYVFGKVTLNELVRFEESGLDSEIWCVPLAIIMSRVQNQTLVTNILKGVVLALGNSENHSPLATLLTESAALGENINVYLMSQVLEENINDTLTSTDSISHPFVDDILKMKVTVIEYAPQLFAKLRRLDDITFEQLSNSLSPANNENSILQVQESVGKSGAFFFFTQDKRFLIKTLNASEKDFLLNNVLIKLANYFISNKTSTLARIYGCFSIQIDGLSTLDLLLMENSLSEVSQIEGKLQIYDLKGSQNNRLTDV